MPDRHASERDSAAVSWLLDSDEPGIVMQVERDLQGARAVDPDAIMRGPLVTRLLEGQLADGGFGVQPYHKWTGAHWRLVSLVELGVPSSDRRVLRALETVLDWVAGDRVPGHGVRIRGLFRVHASIYANPVAVATRLGMADDDRVRKLAAWLVDSQWPDGGWNCDRHTDASHSSFYESITPLWALSSFASATTDRAAADRAREAAGRTAQFFLRHSVYKSHKRDRPGDARWTKLRYPEYWHFDYLHGLVMLARAGALPDARADDALRLLRDQQQPDGRWVPAGPQYWRGGSGPYGDPASWNATTAGQMLTLNALRVLRAASA